MLSQYEPEVRPAGWGQRAINHPMHPDEQAALEQEGFRVPPLVQFGGAEESAENFYVYHLELVPSAPPLTGNLPSHSVETSKGAPHA